MTIGRPTSSLVSNVPCLNVSPENPVASPSPAKILGVVNCRSSTLLTATATVVFWFCVSDVSARVTSSCSLFWVGVLD